jgi:type II secretory pathway pseudopilin PulG
MQRNQAGFSVLEVLFLVVILVVVGAVGVHFYKTHQTDSNSKYFNTLSVHTKTYYAKQAKALGVQNSDNDLVKKCYRSEQGPFDDGNLWCGISVTKKINVQPDHVKLQSLASAFESTLKSQVYNTAVYGSVRGSGGFSVSGNKRDDGDAVCDTRIDYSPKRCPHQC